VQNCNYELAKSIEDLREKREELNTQILKDEEDKAKGQCGIPSQPLVSKVAPTMEELELMTQHQQHQVHQLQQEQTPLRVPKSKKNKMPNPNKIQKELLILTDRLQKINEGLVSKTQARNEFNKTIQETEAQTTQPIPPAIRPREEDNTHRYTGRVKSYSETSGYGFLTGPDTVSVFGVDIFLHQLEVDKLHNMEKRSIPMGTSVSFTVVANKKGQPQARELRYEQPMLPAPGTGPDGNKTLAAIQEPALNRHEEPGFQICDDSSSQKSTSYGASETSSDKDDAVGDQRSWAERFPETYEMMERSNNMKRREYEEALAKKGNARAYAWYDQAFVYPITPATGMGDAVCNWAGSYPWSDQAFIYPITPATEMEDAVCNWTGQGRKNLFGRICEVERN